MPLLHATAHPRRVLSGQLSPAQRLPSPLNSVLQPVFGFQAQQKRRSLSTPTEVGCPAR